jgi:hypothetical protein
VVLGIDAIDARPAYFRQHVTVDIHDQFGLGFERSFPGLSAILY